MLIGVLVVMFYSKYQLRQIDKDYKENTALILEWMRKNHERKMETMEFMNDLRK